LGAGRSVAAQGGYQLAALGVVMGVSIFTGFFVGLLLRADCFLMDETVPLFDDREIWVFEHEHEEHQKLQLADEGKVNEGPYTEVLATEGNKRKDQNENLVDADIKVEMNNIHLDVHVNGVNGEKS